jgi:hypothetical protein
MPLTPRPNPIAPDAQPVVGASALWSAAGGDRVAGSIEQRAGLPVDLVVASVERPQHGLLQNDG